jgi:glycerol-1-phosphatase
MTERLLDRYDTLLIDLDGTVFRGGTAVPGAAAAVEAMHQAGVPIRFVTNNASRGPADVAGHLTELGIAAAESEVATSAQAAAAVLAEKVSAGAAVLVVGTAALAAEIDAVGLVPVREATPDVVAVVQGLSQQTTWSDLAEATLAIRAGALWVACNVDTTLPTDRGLLPGNGALVAAVRAATGAEPLVAGKPAAPLLHEALRTTGGRAALVVGDRLDTDIAGAHNAGLDSLMVLTGVSTVADVLDHGPVPTYLAADLTAVTEPSDALAVAEQPDWAVEQGRVTWRGAGEPDPLRLARALLAARPANLVARDDTAAGALRRLGVSHELA